MKAFIQKAFGILINRAGEGPWRSKSVLAALAMVVMGLGFWVSDIKNGPPQSETGSNVTHVPTVTSPANSHWNWSKPFPFYVPIGASYVAGFCIGWIFRKLIRLIVITAALVVALLALGRFVGCDTTHTQEQVKHTGEWAQHEVTAAEDYLKHLLPSVGAGGVGTFLGFRRRSRAAAPRPADPHTANPPGPE
ncbi:MAG TPA: FUN14 domain-containing protein [Verrucomicrobiae bacterium]|nr:FUN14 domain-containing protein [Verrucomicrobiae bacterium]